MGNLKHYEQVVLNDTNFQIVSKRFFPEIIDVGRWSAPATTDLDDDGLLDLIIGERSGTCSYYRQQELGSASFTLVSDFFVEFDFGSYASPCFIDLDNNGLKDLIVGNTRGNLVYFQRHNLTPSRT